MSKISVVIPCYNYGHFVEEAIDSILKSTFSDFEIIVVDDGSTDTHTKNVLKQLDHPKVKVLTQENQGLSQARNNGILASSCEFFLPLDADDKVREDLLEKFFNIIQSNKEIGFVYSWVQLFGDENHIWYTEPANLQKLIFKNHISVCSLVRKSAWKEVGGYKKFMTYGYEDWEFWLSLLESGWKGKLVEEPLFFHRMHKNSMLGFSNEKRSFLIEQMMLNHKDLYRDYSIEDVLKLQNNDTSIQGALMRQLKNTIPTEIKNKIKKLYKR